MAPARKKADSRKVKGLKRFMQKKGRKRYPCTIEGCRKDYASRAGLLEHEKTHGGQGEFKCKFDGCEFRQHQKINLEAHYRSKKHNGEQPFECSECGKKFSQQGNLDTHKKTHIYEPDQRPFACPVCDFRANQKNNCSEHIRNVHPGNLRVLTNFPLVRCTENQAGKNPEIRCCS
ncbi:gastrula zinc finger protein XlCGF16.1-like [Paramacrobiotus metropolitanus]|uniref:gastrula zinc finger protein XlCGF16.1-like n=1 Tax=Paramacrobiotus metropolitanus TaxID=2943436 RepID=UPI00244601C2|nr:gastrula zinc finger protein XlCGF16.1-like [Paramacrobiotus metropolitanus]